MKQLEVSIEINAATEQVWDILLDFKRYPEWNPFIISLEGTAAIGEKLKEIVLQPDGKPVKFTSQIVILKPFQHLAWDGHVGHPFLFNGRHEFLLESIPLGTRFIQRETFTGLLIPFLNVDSVIQGYHQLNQALKDRVEGRCKT